MQFLTQFSTTRQTTSGAGSSNKGILSLSSNSVINESKGPPLMNRLRDNIMLISTNMHRYTQNSTIRTDISQAVRLIQCYVLFLIPCYSEFWGSNSATSTIAHILNIPLSLCIFTDSDIYRSIVTMLIFLFLTLHAVIIFVILLKNPTESSLSNKSIAWLCWILGCILPIIEVPTFYLAGSALSLVIFAKSRGALSLLCLAFGLINALIGIGAHYFSFAIYRCSPTVKFSGLLRPWPRYVIQIAWIEAIMMFLTLIEGIIDPNNKIQRIILVIILLCFANPLVSAYFMIKPLFQDIEDSVHYAVALTVGFLDLILLIIHSFVNFLTPSLLFTITILFVIVFYMIYRIIAKRKVNKIISRLYSVYKSSRPVLPPLTPVVFTNPLSNQITLSQEAYSVMQTFSSLGIDDEDTFNIFLAVGAKMKVPSIRNIDFIKWGLNYFTSATTLLASSQLIQYFNGCARTETVILQKMREMPSYPNTFKPFIQHLEGLHADIMLDKPVLLQGLCAKANAALSRCKRSIALFWGCVLRRSNSSIREALCRVRNTISEAESHFEELMRCYPHTKQAITLYLSFLTEVKGSFEECNDYLNYLSTYFVARQGDIDLDEDATTDFLSTLLNDETNTFNKYVNQLPIFADHERQAMLCSSSVTNLLFTIAVCSVVVLIGCFTFVIVELLLNIKIFPIFISMIHSISDVTMTLCTATTAARRICLISSNTLEPNTSILPDAQTVENVNVVVQTLIDSANFLSRLIQNFLVSVAYKSKMVIALNHWRANLTHHNKKAEMSLSQALKIISDSVRNIALLVPKGVEEIGPIPNYTFVDYASICTSPDLDHIYANIVPLISLLDNFIEEFKKMTKEETSSLSNMLTLSLEIIPAAFFGIFLVLVLISASIAFKESKFRATLFLSLPEQVASGFFRAESGRPTKKPAGIESIFAVSSPTGRVETESTKDKIQIIEKLHEFSSVEQKGYNTGLQGYTISMIAFLFLSSISILGLLIYGLNASRKFDSQTLLTCYNVIRNVCVQYSMFLTQELFLPENVRLLSNNELLNYATIFVDKSLHFHDEVVFGDDNSASRNFKEFKEFEDLFLVFDESKPNFSEIGNSVLMIHHESYTKFGFDLKTRLFFNVIKGFIDSFRKIPDLYHVNDEHWKQFDHFLNSHLEAELREASNIYFKGISEVIMNSFYSSLTIFIVCFVFLMILYFVFVIPSIIILRRFFDCGVRLLCQVPHNVFQRSLFINKWLKGQITRSNFMALETHFNRSISPALQSKLIKELPESIYLFDLQGNYVNSPSFDCSHLEDKTMKSILPLIVDASHDFQLLSVAESAMTKIAEAKDNVQPTIYQAKSVNGVPIRLTFVGVSAAEAGIISKDSVLRQYYSYIAILARDITQEANQELQYHQQKEHTINLMKQLVPLILVDRVHDGERRISNNPIDGSAILMQICDFTKFVQNIDINLLPSILQQFHLLIDGTIADYPNVTLISFSSGYAIFATGLFDDELTERVKAIDSVNFVNVLYGKIEQYVKSIGIDLKVRFAIATNQMVYKMQLDVSLISFITGDAVQLANFLLKKAKPSQILVERRTYECIYGQNCDTQHVGEFEFKSSIVTIYSITAKPPS